MLHSRARPKILRMKRGKNALLSRRRETFAPLFLPLISSFPNMAKECASPRRTIFFGGSVKQFPSKIAQEKKNLALETTRNGTKVKLKPKVVAPPAFPLPTLSFSFSSSFSVREKKMSCANTIKSLRRRFCKGRGGGVLQLSDKKKPLHLWSRQPSRTKKKVKEKFLIPLYRARDRCLMRGGRKGKDFFPPFHA